MVELSQSSQKTTSSVKLGMQKWQMGSTNAQISYGAQVKRKTTMSIANERALLLSRDRSFFALAVVWLSSAAEMDDEAAVVREDAIIRPRE